MPQCMETMGSAGLQREARFSHPHTTAPLPRPSCSQPPASHGIAQSQAPRLRSSTRHATAPGLQAQSTAGTLAAWGALPPGNTIRPPSAHHLPPRSAPHLELWHNAAGVYSEIHLALRLRNCSWAGRTRLVGHPHHRTGRQLQAPPPVARSSVVRMQLHKYSGRFPVLLRLGAPAACEESRQKHGTASKAHGTLCGHA